MPVQSNSISAISSTFPLHSSVPAASANSPAVGECSTSSSKQFQAKFSHEKNVTELSKHIWSLKERQINYQIKWRKVKQARSYSNVNKKCNLCLWEKYFIICKPEMSTLNRRNEMTSTCRHSKKFLLSTAVT